jgi:hypothetical protein
MSGLPDAVIDDSVLHVLFLLVSAVMAFFVWLLNRSIARIDADIASKASVESVTHLGDKMDDIKEANEKAHRETRESLQRIYDRMLDRGDRRS